MAELKPLSKEGIPKALDKAELYRLLNEPEDAESICKDILEVEPENQKALIMLVLSRSDQLAGGDPKALERARRVLPRLTRPYDRAYYEGLICERHAKHLLRQRGPHTSAVAYHWFRHALEEYGKAMELGESGSDEVVLRWNTCVRLIERYGLEAIPEEPLGLGLE